MKYRYTKFTGDALDELDLEDLVSKLSDLLLSSGFGNPHGHNEEERTLQALHDAILDALFNGGVLPEETIARLLGDPADGDQDEARSQLEELIQTINTESSLRFEQTFNAVREHFQGMFRKLFGGGRADIYLETELEEKVKVQGEDGQMTTELRKRQVDPLEAGIEVIARPPGKQPVSISQLSGGEKAMTCIALLMSIFKSKPSPFCILDEVDAALDEANNQRFNLIVQEFLDQSQFIVITHSKRTMTIADQLYGITQQEQGVSRRVAVKFEQIGKDGTIAAAAVKEEEAREKAKAKESELAAV